MLWAYQTGYFSIDVILKEQSLITLTKLEPNKTTISLTQNEQASKLILALFSDRVRLTSTIHGFDQLENNESKKIVTLFHNDKLSTNRHFFHLYIDPSNNHNLTSGTYEGYIQIDYNNSRDIKTESVKIELEIIEFEPEKSISVTR